MKRIAFFLPDLSPGGAEKTGVLLASALARRNLPVDFVLVNARGEFLQLLHPSIRIIDLKARSSYTCLPDLVKYLRQEKPDALISGLDLTNLIALFAKIMSGSSVKIFLQLQNAQSRLSRVAWKKFIERLLIQLFYPGANRLIAVSKGVEEDFYRYSKIESGKVITIHNMIITDSLFELARVPLEHPFFSANCPPVILAVGRFSEQKNYPLLIETFKLVLTQKDARLSILGQGEGKNQIEMLAQSLGIMDKISFPGHDTNPYRWMASADVFVMSSNYEGLPTVMVEAMACGCPVVSTDCPFGPDEITHHGDYGYLTPLNDAPALANAILKVLNGQTKRPPQAWLAQFAEESIVEEYLRLLM